MKQNEEHNEKRLYLSQFLEHSLIDSGKKTRFAPHAISILPALRLRNLGFLLLYALGLLVAIVTLRQFARRSGLHQAFFTYRISIKLFGKANTLSPLTIIPTLLSIVIALWWESLDATCRAVQPFISMLRGKTRPSQGAGLSYASSFWLAVCIKALLNQHWLLLLVTATTFVLQIRKY